MIMKVCAGSEALLALADFDPVFVSQNDYDAVHECDVLFPLGYVNVSEEQAEAELEMALAGAPRENEEDQK